MSTKVQNLNVDNLNKVINAIENAKDEDVTMHMIVTHRENDCGAAGCLIGWSHVVQHNVSMHNVLDLWSDDDDWDAAREASEFLGLEYNPRSDDSTESDKLFMPKGWMYDYNSTTYPRSRVLRTLRHLATTHEINWEV